MKKFSLAAVFTAIAFTFTAAGHAQTTTAKPADRKASAPATQAQPRSSSTATVTPSTAPSTTPSTGATASHKSGSFKSTSGIHKAGSAKPITAAPKKSGFAPDHQNRFVQEISEQKLGNGKHHKGRGHKGHSKSPSGSGTGN